MEADVGHLARGKEADSRRERESEEEDDGVLALVEYDASKVLFPSSPLKLLRPNQKIWNKIKNVNMIDLT
ncbi:hypothetical protein L1887_33156 [Cichorium endivia]|nr:hypothetical protein L1887_33156 [Cichorium endivia]